MRDLEIRGSGDILGTRQHGYIAAVGFHLYTRLLADTVKQVNKDNLDIPGGRELPFQLKKEFQDRFGPVPGTVENLFAQLEIKLLAEVAGVEGISIQSGQINLQYPEGKPLPQPWEFNLRVRYGESSIWIPLDLGSDDWLVDLSAILKGLTAH